MSLNFKFSENNNILKEINLTIATLELNDYRKSLQSLKVSVNEYLTQLVNCEAAGPDPLKDDEDLSSSDSESLISPKRNLSTDRGDNKIKHTKH